MTKNWPTPLQGSKSTWLSSAKANEFIDHSTSTPPLCLDATTPKLNFLKNPLYNEENYINLLHYGELLHSNTKNIKIIEQLKLKPSEPSEQLKLSLAKQLTDIRNSKHQIYLEDKNNTTKNVSNKIYISCGKSLNIDENGRKEHPLLLEIQWWKELMRDECQANGLLKSKNSQEQPSVTCTTT